MRLPFSRPQSDAGGAPGSAAAVEPASMQAARTQARRRLMGALVLLVGAVALFPLIFETQPRPVRAVAGAEGASIVLKSDPASRPAPAAEMPAPQTAPAPPQAAATVDATVDATVAAVAAAPAKPASAAASAPARASSVLTPASAARPVATASAPAAVAKAPAAKVELTPPAPAADQPAPAAGAASGPAGTQRWVVQVGAYNDMERMRQARQKAEKLGFKTYTTEVDTSTGKRTRVRLGPFATRKQADDAAARVKANGMDANILSL